MLEACRRLPAIGAAVPTNLPLRPAGDAPWQEVEGRIVFLSLPDGEYSRLDRVGARVWNALLEHGSIDAALPALEAHYDVPAAVLRRDVCALVAELVDAGLIAVDD